MFIIIFIIIFTIKILLPFRQQFLEKVITPNVKRTALCTETMTRLKTAETSTRLFHPQIVGQLSLHGYARAP